MICLFLKYQPSDDDVTNPNIFRSKIKWHKQQKLKKKCFKFTTMDNSIIFLLQRHFFKARIVKLSVILKYQGEVWNCFLNISFLDAQGTRYEVQLFKSRKIWVKKSFFIQIELKTINKLLHKTHQYFQKNQNNYYLNCCPKGQQIIQIQLTDLRLFHA